MGLLAKIGFLPDELEQPLFGSQRDLEQIGVHRLTPLGVLYLLCKDPKTGGQLEKIIGQNYQELAGQARRRLITLYPNTSRFTANPQVELLLEQAVNEAGGVNRAGVGHLLLAFFTMPEAETSDAYRFLSDRDVKEDMVREALMQGVGTLDESTLLTNIAQEVLSFPEPLVETETLKRERSKLTTILATMQCPSILIYGPEGIGSHTLLRSFALEVLRGKIDWFKGYALLLLNLPELRRLRNLRQSDPEEALREATQDLEKAIVIVDDFKAEDYPLIRSLLIEGRVPLTLISNAIEAKAMEGKDPKWLYRLEVGTSTEEEIKQIVRAHLDLITSYHNLSPDLDELALENLIRHGPLVTGLVNPGGAFRLLDMAAASDQSPKRDNKLSLKDIARVVAEMKGVQIQAISQPLREKILNLETYLSERVVGQSRAKKALFAALARRGAGLGDVRRPIGVFFFLGPTGVGKTETAKALAEALFGSEDALIRFDMSEHQEPHTIARLIGSPPGYVGYYEGGRLVNEVRSRPYSVILFDEIDKAHPDVYNVLLHMLDDGRLTDGRGVTANCSNTVIIFTSNHGSPLFLEATQSEKTFAEAAEEALRWLGVALRPEFLNRLDQIIVFDPLTREDSAKIIDLLLERLVKKPFAQRGIKVQFDQAAKEFLLERGFDEAFGARPLIRVIQQEVLDPLAVWTLRGELRNGERVRCSVLRERDLVFRK